MDRGLAQVHTKATAKRPDPTLMHFPLNYDNTPASQENGFMIPSISCSEGPATGFMTEDVRAYEWES